MKIYAYKAAQFANSFLVGIIDQDGFIYTMFECWSYKKAPEIAQKFAPPGSELIWLANPWASDEFKEAQRRYKVNFQTDSYNQYSTAPAW